jgi:tetratricopeptide (TPR) repeat protein
LSELRLLFARTGDALTCRIATSWAGDAGEAEPFVPFPSDDDHEDLRWYLEDYMDLPIGGAKVRAERIEGSLDAWGRKLFDAMFGSDDRRELFNVLVHGKAARLLTVGTTDLDVLRLPWELMADSRGPLTQQGVTIRRQVETARRPEAYETGKLPLRILLAVSRPDDTGFLDPRHTTRAMLDALAPLGDGVVVDFCRPATLRMMERMLVAADRDGRPYHLAHFDGHGQTGALCFETEDDEGDVLTDPVRADQLGQLLAKHKIPVAILEACRSGQVDRIGAFRGVAPALIEAGVGSVLAMSHAVHVEATRILLARFYERLAGGASIGQALEAGRAALMAQPDRWLTPSAGGKTVALQDWFLPNLYQGGADLVLVPGGAERAPRSATKPEARRAPAQGDEAGAFPGNPMYGFFGRAWELHRLERRFLTERAVVLHAMGGMGKTSLAREAAFWGSRTGMFPDGACFVSFEQAGGAERAVQVIGAYFEGAEFEKRQAEEQRQRARELFQTKRVLVVWDNFESVLPAFQEGEDVMPYPDEEREEVYKLFCSWVADEKGLGRLLVTCRPEETALGVCKVELAGLARTDALSLLYTVMQKAGVAKTYEQEALVYLLKAVEMHPLSIELVGPHLKSMGPEEIVSDFQRLLDGFKGEAEVERNRSLKASIGFSLMRLSTGARDAVRWLGLFRGGVFEQLLLDVSKMDPVVWAEARRELEATALVEVEREIEVDNKPYLRFHPTLAVAAGGGAAEAGVTERYVGVYLALTGGANEGLHGSNPRWGMEVMLREEANIRFAVRYALEAGAYNQASSMGDTLRFHLERSGRLRERDRWSTWLAQEVGKGGFSAAAANREQDEARALLSQGQPQEAVAKLEALVERLREMTQFDAAFTLAHAIGELGRLYTMLRWSQKAIPILNEAVQRCEALVERARAAGESADAERGILAATLADLTNAFGAVGMLDKALAASERTITILRELGHDRDLGAALGQAASILAEQGRYAEANVRCEDALHAAQRASDREMEATVLQHQADLACNLRQYGRATQLCHRALRLFQDMHAEDGIMEMCNMLGAVEQQVGRLPEARAWFQRSRDIAERLKDGDFVGIATHNLGLVCRHEGEAARTLGNETRARKCLTEANRYICESLAMKIENQDQPGMASSYSELAWIKRLLKEFDQAEAHAHRARDIRERLDLKEVVRDYDTLADIAHARNQPAEAAAWEQKREALLAELQRRAGVPALPQEAIEGITQFALACAEAGLERAPLNADVEEALANLSTWPAPLAIVASFLRALAAGALPALPPALPRELRAPLMEILDAVRQARTDG